MLCRITYGNGMATDIGYVDGVAGGAQIALLKDAGTQAMTLGWDSVGHMQLMTQLEDVFGIALEMDDILEFSGYEKGMDIMRKYGVAL